MKAKGWFSLICLMALAVPACAASGEGKRYERSALSLPIFPAPLVRRGMPLPRALDEVGSLLRGGYALFGVELRLEDGQEPTVNVDLKPGSTLGDALRQILAQLPCYRLEVVSPHMINIYPAGAKDDREDVLNLRVAKFDAVNVQPTDILSRPQDFIPELKARLTPNRVGPPQPSGYIGPGLSSIGPTVTLQLKQVTVREVLNATSEAMAQFPSGVTPVGWLYTFQPDPSSPIGGKHSWTIQWSVPRDWKGPNPQTKLPKTVPQSP